MLDRFIQSEVIGSFVYEEMINAYTYQEDLVHWALDVSNETSNIHEMLQRAEKLYGILPEFDNRSKAVIADELTTFKNEFWPEYDENDEELNWDDVDAGKYDVTKERFADAIKLLDIVIVHENIYCEYDDGELFGGHRIHVYYDNNYNLVSAEI